MKRMLGLFSGGLDSWLAARILIEQGVRVECVHVDTGFVWDARRRAVARLQRSPGELGIERLHVEPAGAGYPGLQTEEGSGVRRRCIDCRVHFLALAARVARERRIEILFTGDVVGQGGAGQTHEDLRTIDRRAGIDGRLLRPLSARLLPSDGLEQRVGLDRSALGRLHGRARRGSLDLARRYDLERVAPAPADGCCWLSDPRFARRFRDWSGHADGRPPGGEEIELLKIGRHFRLGWRCKAIVARNEDESARLAASTAVGERWQVADGRGAVVLCDATDAPGEQETVAALALHFSRRRGQPGTAVLRRMQEASEERLANPIDPARLETWRI